MSDVLPGRMPPGTAQSAELFSTARSWWTPRGRSYVSAGGRAVVVLMAVSVSAAAAHPVDLGRLPAIALVACIWLICLRAAAADAPVALGPRVPAAVGTLT